MAIENELLLRAQLKDNQHPTLKTLQTYSALYIARFAFAVSKANVGLLHKINAGLAKAQADGTVKALGVKWGVKQAERHTVVSNLCSVAAPRLIRTDLLWVTPAAEQAWWERAAV